MNYIIYLMDGEEDYSLLNRSKINENEYKIVLTKRMIVFGIASIIGLIILSILMILFLTNIKK